MGRPTKDVFRGWGWIPPLSSLRRATLAGRGRPRAGLDGSRRRPPLRGCVGGGLAGSSGWRPAPSSPRSTHFDTSWWPVDSPCGWRSACRRVCDAEAALGPLSPSRGGRPGRRSRVYATWYLPSVAPAPRPGRAPPPPPRRARRPETVATLGRRAGTTTVRPPAPASPSPTPAPPRLGLSGSLRTHARGRRGGSGSSLGPALALGPPRPRLVSPAPAPPAPHAQPTQRASWPTVHTAPRNPWGQSVANAQCDDVTHTTHPDFTHARLVHTPSAGPQSMGLKVVSERG